MAGEVSESKSTSASLWSVRLAALLTAMMGVVNLVSAMTPSLHGRVAVLRSFLPRDIRYGSHLAAVLTGFALLLLALSLLRRKRAAWYLTLIALVGSAAFHLTKGLDWEEASLALILAVCLATQRRHFFARSDSPSVRQGIRLLAFALLGTLAYGAVGFWLLDRHFKVDFGLRAALLQTFAMFAEFSDPGLEPTTGFGRWFADSIYFVGATTGGYALISLLRPVLHRNRATFEERARAKEIVEAHGCSSLARFLLFDDKSYWFSPGGSLVAFAVVGRTCVALGDPIGPVADVSNAITGFRDFCVERDWQPAFYQTLPGYLLDYRKAGFDVLAIGDEAIVDLKSFTLVGSANKSLRNAVNRLQKVGYRTKIHLPPHSDELMEELRAISDEWLSTQNGREKRFSLGWFDDEYLQDGPVMVVYTPENRISAFANIIPEYGVRESTIDLMRRRTEIANGTMDLLFVALFEWAREQGYETFNLGLCPLAGVGEEQDDPAVERAVRFIYEHVNQFYNFKGLFDYKSKFHPTWSPRYMIYSNSTALPLAALAVIRADNGDLPFWEYWK